MAAVNLLRHSKYNPTYQLMTDLSVMQFNKKYTNKNINREIWRYDFLAPDGRFSM